MALAKIVAFSCGCGNNNSSNGGEAIREGELTALAQADVYLLNPMIDKARGAVFIGGHRGLVDWP